MAGVLISLVAVIAVEPIALTNAEDYVVPAGGVNAVTLFLPSDIFSFLAEGVRVPLIANYGTR